MENRPDYSVISKVIIMIIMIVAIIVIAITINKVTVHKSHLFLKQSFEYLKQMKTLHYKC